MFNHNNVKICINDLLIAFVNYDILNYPSLFRSEVINWTTTSI